MISVKFDTKLFDTGMILAANAAMTGSRSGMLRAMEKFKNDALTKPPACPVKTGRMAKHHVTNVAILGKSVVGSLSVVDSPQAASLHEGISRWGTPYVYKTPGTGMKWIDSKMLMYNKTYLDSLRSRIAARLRSVLGVIR